MKKVLGIALLMVFAATAFGAQPALSPADPAGSPQSASRTLTGYVSDKANNPLPDAIVYLKNTKTLGVKTFIADTEATYRFPGLSPNVDYEVWAEFHGKKSDTKTLSSFDSRPNARINLKIDTK